MRSFRRAGLFSSSFFAFDYPGIFSLHCSLSLVPRGSLLFSIVILVFFLVVQSISLCRCRSSFGKSVVNVVSFIRCLMFLFTRAKGSPRLCFIYSRCHFVFLSLLFYPSLCVSYACRPSFMKRGSGECPRCLIEGSLQIVRNVVSILAEQAPKTEPKWNCPSALVFVDSSHFSCKTSTKVYRCFVVKERDSVFCSHQKCMDVRATFVSSARAAGKLLMQTCRPFQGCRSCLPDPYHLLRRKNRELQWRKRLSLKNHALRRTESILLVVFQFSDVSFVVRCFPSTHDTLGYCDQPRKV